MNPAADEDRSDPERDASRVTGADAGDDGSTARDDATAAPVEPAIPPAGESLEDFRDRWLRAEAELQNFRRRAQRELEQVRRDSEEAVLLEIIRVLDDLERAQAARDPATAPDGWSQGVALVTQTVRDYLVRMGVESVDPTGTRFDPRFHEAILEVDAPPGIAPGMVAQVALRGYRRGERALRPARVLVTREPAGSER
ncbi:MAG: nucleotide exchange factor GrpE [Candidatus Eisenbacteria bacterium]|uniref:Protein GrpE n=1 Tax=Eiseniibacteriota bacterium TaxID=2212470 RepID=A0A849STA8_UNCEI|nr:nucleotide exchange factor GrpE [Candidatus Eisenbacteria bacterium]